MVFWPRGPIKVRATSSREKSAAGFCGVEGPLSSADADGIHTHPHIISRNGIMASLASAPHKSVLSSLDDHPGDRVFLRGQAGLSVGYRAALKAAGHHTSSMGSSGKASLPDSLRTHF